MKYNIGDTISDNRKVVAIITMGLKDNQFYKLIDINDCISYVLVDIIDNL